MVISSLGCLGYLFFANTHTIPMFVVCLFMKGVGYGSFWGSAFVYSSDLSDYISKKYHVVAAEMASMTSSVGIKIGVGVGSGIVGFLLTAVGYDSTLAVQSEATISGIHKAFSLCPLFFSIALLICLCLWKLDITTNNSDEKNKSRIV